MRDYRITIRSTVDGDTSEVITFGEVFKEYGATTVSYMDEELNSPTRIVFGGGIVNIIREGDYSSVLTFERGKTTTSALETEFGDIPVALETTDVDCGEWDGGLKINLAYETVLGGERSRFDVTVRAERIN